MKKGFTLVEILIILAFIAFLTTLVLMFINPIEIAKRNRDLQRIKDLQTLASAINTYLATANNPDLDGPLYDSTGLDEENPAIYFSVAKDLATFTFSTITDAYGNKWQIVQHSSKDDLYNNNGEGWLPINFNEGNVVLPTLPIDPLNKINNNSNKNYFYLYVFRRETGEFELNGKLESKIFERQTEEDGGSDKEIFETGNNKCLIAFGTSAAALYGTTTVVSCSVEKLDFGLLPGNIAGQDICWNKLFNYYPTRNYVFRNRSGDYLLIGNNYLSSTTSIYLSFFDKFGNFKFTKEMSFNTNTSIALKYVYQMNSGDYILGYNFDSATIKSSLIIKLDQNLNINWAKYYCYSGNCSAEEKLIFLNEYLDGYLNLIRNTGINNGFQIIKISSSSGEILEGSDYRYNIYFGKLYAGDKVNDGGYILLGTYGSTTLPSIFLSKLNNKNQFEWIKIYNRFSASSDYRLSSPRDIFIFNTNDGGYLFNAMYDINLNTTSYNFVKVDYKGDIEWIKKYDGDWSKINVRKIYQDNKNNFWLIVNSSSENYLIKLDRDFNKIGEFQIKPKSSNDSIVFNNFYQLFENSYIILGNFTNPLQFFVFIKYVFGDRDALEEGSKNKNPNYKNYFNLIKFINENNLFYLNNNLFTITSTNLFYFSNITSSVSDLATFTTSSYTVTSYSLNNISSSLVKVKEKTLVNQCDNYFSKSIVENKIIERLIKIDNDYLVVGSDLLSNTSSFWIAKISTSGEIITSTSYRLDDSYLGHKFESVIKDGNNFIAVGNYTGNYSDTLYSHIAKFNNQLSLINSKVNYSSQLFDIKFDNNYYLVVGEELQSVKPRALLNKLTTSSLDVVASSTYGENSSFNTLLIDNNSYYFAGGQINNQPYLVKINSTTLSSVWEKEYLLKSGANEEIKKIIFDNDGNIIALSNLFDPEDNKFKVVLRKINPIDGDIITEKLISDNYFYGKDIILDYNNDFLITGFLPLKQENNFSDWTLILMKVSKDFNLVWHKYYGGISKKKTSFGASIVEAYDSGYLIGGYNGANNSAWLLKVSYLGDCLGCFQISYFNKFWAIIKNNFANFLNLFPQ